MWKAVIKKLAAILDGVYVEPWRILLGPGAFTLRWWAVAFFLVLVYSISVALAYEAFVWAFGWDPIR
jgi:hypothetical protein